MTKNSLGRAALLGAMLLAVPLTGGCAAEEPSGLSRDEVRDAQGDPTTTRRHCMEMGAAEDCDLCEAIGLYADAICDDFCPAMDPGCAQETCGGIAGLQCPRGQRCEYNPMECDPMGGGADCAGICVPDEPEPETCGGIAGLQCPRGQRCEYNPMECDPMGGGADCAGICVPDDKPEGDRCGGKAGTPCPMGEHCEDDPSDDCNALSGGADCIGICVADSTEPSPGMEPTGETCGGFAGRQCPMGDRCIDDPNDDCHPMSGGADCIGICVRG